MTFLENSTLAMFYKQNRLNANWQSMTHLEDKAEETTESLISCSDRERPIQKGEAGRQVKYAR